MFGYSNEPVTLARDVTAIIIPVGEPVSLKEGTSGFITQALGGSFSVYVEGNLFRVAGYDADALGKDPVPPPEVPDNASDADIEAVIWKQLMARMTTNRATSGAGSNRTINPIRPAIIQVCSTAL